MTLLICGSREYPRRDKVTRYVKKLADTTVVLVGDARGVDRWVYEVAQKRGLKVTRFKADWNRLGRKAGITRNLEMLDCLPKQVTAFWDGESKGTAFMINTCLKRHINLKVIFEFGKKD